MDEQGKQINVDDQKEKKQRSISVVVGDNRKVSFAKKSSSDDDVRKHAVIAKRRTKSVDYSSTGSSVSSRASRESGKAAVLFAISEDSDAIDQTEKTIKVSDEESSTTVLPFNTEDDASSLGIDKNTEITCESQPELPKTRENSASTHPRRASSVISSETSSYITSAGTTSTRRSSYSISGYSTSTRSTGSTGRIEDSSLRIRRISTQQNAAVGDANSRLLNMALRREWTQLEISLRFMNKADPEIYVVDDETGLNPLMLAARDNRITIVERLLEMGVNVNDQSRDGQGAIHFAVSYGREEIVNMLIKKKADMSAKGGDKYQLPLHIACSRSGNNAVAITQAVLRATNRTLRLEPDKDGNIPLFLAIEYNNQGAYRELLSQYVVEQLSYQNPMTGNTVLHVACEKRDAEMVRLFCKKGAPVDIQNNKGSTALHIAATMGDGAIIECLYGRQADAAIVDKQERTALHIAAEKGYTGVAELLAERYPKAVLRRTKDGSTLMHIASEYGHPETALAFLKKGVPLHMPNKSGAVCLHSAAKNNHVDVVATLLKKGAHVEARTKDKLTALHVAVKFCRPLVVQVLLGYGAPVQIKGGDQQETPLHLAAQVAGGEQVAEMLIKSGADVNSARDDGETAVHMAARKGNLSTFKLLLEEGGELKTQSKSGENALHIAVRHCRLEIVEHMLTYLETQFSRYEAKLCVNMENKEGETPMHLAAELTGDRAPSKNDDLKIVGLLLAYEGDINLCTKLTQETPVHYCARSGNSEALKMLLNHIGKDHNKMSSAINRPAKNGWSPLLFASDEGHSASVDILLQNSARVDVFDENSKAALHLAAENGHAVITDMLIRKKAYVNAKTKQGLTPLHIAAHRGFSELVKMLINPVGSDQKATIDAMTLDNKTPLHKAAENGKIEVCEILLQAGANVKAADSDGQTPLHLAAENDHSNVVKKFLAHQTELVTMANKNGATCAHIAASKGSVAVIRELLLSNKESVITATMKSSNSTALHLASIGGHADVVRELVLNGASLMNEDSNGMNALLLSAKYGHTNITEVILNNKFAIETKTKLSLSHLWQSVSSKSGLNALHVATKSGKENFAREMLLRIRAADPSQPPGIKIDNSRDTAKDHGFTPLHLASHSGHVSLVRMILNYPGVSVDAFTAVQKLTPLHLAAKSGFVDVVHLLLSKSIAQLTCADAKGFTCLHYAAAFGHVDMASLLLGQGAKIESQDNKGLTPLHLAAQSGSLKMVRLLTESGASTLKETESDKKIPIQFAASSGHHEVVTFLLKCDHDSHKLIDDKAFIVDLMSMTKSVETNIRAGSAISPYSNDDSSSKGVDILEEFVLASKTPIEIASKLSRAFYVSSNREKEQAKNLLECSSYCESLTVDLIEICSGMNNGANKILQATDKKSTTFLDILIETEQKIVVSNPAVQKYLSDIWAGNLKWANWKFVLLFLAVFICPIFWLIFSLPLQWRLNRTPIIKFLVYLVSHLYLVTLFIITVAIPLTPIFNQGDLFPEWNEWLLLVWVSGLMVGEIVNPSRRTGIAMIRYIVLALCSVAVVVHLVALALPYSTDPQEIAPRLEAIYARNIILSFAMTFAFVQLLEFLSFHHLFGPWSIIIEGLLNDLIKFGVIVLLFVAAFTMWLAAVYQPVYAFQTNVTNIVGGGDGSDDTHILNPLETFQILFFAMFGLIEPHNLPPVSRNPLASIYLVQIVFGLFNIITLIVLINLLIAMMSDTYQRIQAQSDIEWKFGRAKLIRNMKRTSSSPSPINLFVITYQYINLLIKNKCRACDVGLNQLEETDGDSLFQLDSSDVITNHIHWSTTADNSTTKHQTDSSDPTHTESYLQNHREIGKNSTLEGVVDWSIVKQKYWQSKGKEKSDPDLLSAIQPHIDSVNERARANGHPPRLLSRMRSSKWNDVINITTDRNPHSVPYDDDIT